MVGISRIRMAYCSILILLTPIISETIAQRNDYSLFASDFVLFLPNSQLIIPEGCYNCVDFQYLIGARVESSDSSESSTVYRFNQELRATEGQCYKPGPSIIGDSLIEDIYGKSYFFSSKGDTLVIDRFLRLGESAKIFEFENGDYLLSSVVSHETESFLKVTDSVKTISLQLFDVNNNDKEGIINDQLIKISKSYGLVQFFNIRDFPFEDVAVVDLHLETNSLLDNNRILLTKGKVYDFDIGDEFHYHIDDYYLGPDGYKRIARTVIGKEMFLDADSIRYTLKERGGGCKIEYIDNTFVYNTFKIDTTYTITYSNLSELIIPPDIMPFEAIKINDYTLGNVLIIKNLERYNSRYSARINGSELMINEDCAYPPHDSYYGTFTYYIEGCGHLFNEISAEINEECHPCEDLIYFRKGDDVWGEPLSTQQNPLANKIELYPNPAIDFVRIQSHTEISTIEIYSLIGRLILFQDDIGLNISILDVSQFLPGIYALRIRDMAGIDYMEKLIIE